MRHQLNFKQRIAFNLRRLMTEAVKEGVAVASLTVIFGCIGYIMVTHL